MDNNQVREKINQVAKKIANKFHPDKIILFGSYAWGKPTKDSDVDLLIVKKTDNTRRTVQEISGSLWKRPFPMDIIVYTPDMIEKRLGMGDFFINNILTKGKVLYDNE